ncbi:hypothetical protein ONZ45_g7858 [Pleurotus djamor]|nr:hypothetical protein ONZ45_g7858 [Pleurotus djamor]
MCPIIRFLDTSPTVEEVTQKIEDLREDIRILEGYRNARLLIVSRLPTEVLSIIFERVAVLESRQAYLRTQNRWMYLSQVCRLWRNVMINTPRIWGTIYFHNKLEQAKFFLERSRSAPLHIKSASRAPNLDTAALWFQNASRLRTIMLDLTSLEPASWIPLFKKLKLSTLETLHLWCRQTVHLEFASEVDAGRVPLLRDVKLSCCSFDLQTPFVSRVRWLTMGYPIDSLVHRRIPEVMLALRDMKHLETLELTYLFDFSNDIPGDLLIELPRLEELMLRSKDPRVVLMLRNFACPNIRSVVASASDVIESRSLAKEIAESHDWPRPYLWNQTYKWIRQPLLPIHPDRRRKYLSVTTDHSICLALVSVFEGPNLEILTLTTSTTTNFEFAIDVDAEHVPFLRAVSLYDCSFDLRTPIVSQVRSLAIRNNGNDDVYRPMLEVMLALRDMKQLELLELAEVLEFSEDIPEGLLIELPRLEKIKLKTWDPRVALMFQSFACANIRSIVIDTTDTVESDDLAKQVVSAFYSILPATPSSTRLKVKASNSNLATTIFVEPDLVVESVSAPAESPQASRLQLHVPNDYSICLSLASVSLDRAPKILEVYLGPNNRENPINFMRSLDSVEKLVVPSVQDLLVVMSDVPNKTQVNKARRGTILPFSLPSLKHIDVTSYREPGRRDRTLNHLQKALERRRNINAGIEVLRINSYFRRSELEILESEVQSLEYY